LHQGQGTGAGVGVGALTAMARPQVGDHPYCPAGDNPFLPRAPFVPPQPFLLPLSDLSGKDCAHQSFPGYQDLEANITSVTHDYLVSPSLCLVASTVTCQCNLLVWSLL
jgi:hypothetical protein